MQGFLRTARISFDRAVFFSWCLCCNYVFPLFLFCEKINLYLYRNNTEYLLLLNELSRLEGRSTKELSIDELSMLRVELESSKAIKELEGRRRPKRGGVMYSFVSLLLLAMWKEVRGQTYKGVLNSLGNHDLICLDLKRKPSVGTFCHFARGRTGRPGARSWT